MPETPKTKKTAKNFRSVHAFDLRTRAEDDIAEAVGLVRDEQRGGRGLALVGIGSALCSIATTLDRLADEADHPLMTVDLLIPCATCGDRHAAASMINGAEGPRCSNCNRVRNDFATLQDKIATIEAVQAELVADSHPSIEGLAGADDVQRVREALEARIASLEKTRAEGSEAPADIEPRQHTVEARIGRWRQQEGGKEEEGFIELMVDAEEALAAYRQRYGEIDHTAEEIARAFAGPICADGTCCFNALEGAYYCAAHMPEGTVEIEIVVAVVCVDCQIAHGHDPGRCGDTTCAVCSGGIDLDNDNGPLCISCNGELVLDDVAELVARGARCANGSEFWCSVHCPLDRASSTLGQSRYHNCAGTGARCSEHCS